MMTLAERLYWFQYDCGRRPRVEMWQISEGIEKQEFKNAVIADLLKIIAEANQGIKTLGEPDDGYEQMLYDDLVELHNRATDLCNELMKGGN